MDTLAALNEQMRVNGQTQDLMRLIACWGLTRSSAAAYDVFLERFPRAPNADLVRKAQVQMNTKAAVLPGTTTDATWAAPLVPTSLIDAFWPLVRHASVLAQLPVSRVPFNVNCPWVTTGASFAWIGEGLQKAMTKISFDTLRIPPSKCAGTIALTEELVRLAVSGSELVMQTALINGATDFVDQQLLNPANVGGPGHPASITAAATPIASTGDLNADLSTLTAAFWTANPHATKAVLIMSGQSASHVAKVRPLSGVTVNGGYVDGIPIAITPAALTNIIAIDAAMLAVADQGMALDVSDQAAVQMDSAPDSPATATTVLTSFWQLGQVGVRVERFVGWMVRPGTVQYLAGVTR